MLQQHSLPEHRLNFSNFGGLLKQLCIDSSLTFSPTQKTSLCLFADDSVFWKIDGLSFPYL
ncbi:hypothetical protein ACE6ED_21220, partial [Paenibacillus sp. CN-4]|uniref:hypothetical protein n=1 Tax=Paenibacillus nanchangensis TaxID=3348343 RepID=UPI00397DFEF0